MDEYCRVWSTNFLLDACWRCIHNHVCHYVVLSLFELKLSLSDFISCSQLTSIFYLTHFRRIKYPPKILPQAYSKASLHDTDVLGEMWGVLDLMVFYKRGSTEWFSHLLLFEWPSFLITTLINLLSLPFLSHNTERIFLLEYHPLFPPFHLPRPTLLFLWTLINLLSLPFLSRNTERIFLPPSLVLPFFFSQHYRCLRMRILQSAAVQGRVVQSTKYPDCPSQKSCTSAPYLPVETSSAFNKKTRNFPSS